MAARLLVALAFVGCAGVQLMAWPVECGVTSKAELDARWRAESRALEAMYERDGRCDGADFRHVQECPGWLAVWRRYWDAVHELERCE